MFTAGDIRSPALILLHGFLGSCEDWEEWVKELAADYFCCVPDLSHARSPTEVLQGLSPLPLQRPTLIGYSMGGRIALQLTHCGISWERIVAISAHIGLNGEEERCLCEEKEQHWIELLEKGSMHTFLEEWYAQPLFASLKRNLPLFERVWKRRERLDPHLMVEMLQAFRLSKQPAVSLDPTRTLLLYGEEDLKYARLYATLPSDIAVQAVPRAGHAAHLENPTGCIQHILVTTHAHTRRESASCLENKRHV